MLINWLDRVRHLLADRLPVDYSEIAAEDRLREDLNADSLDLATLLVAVEQEFSIHVPDKDWINLKTVQDLAAYLEHRRKTRPNSELEHSD